MSAMAITTTVVGRWHELVMTRACSVVITGITKPRFSSELNRVKATSASTHTIDLTHWNVCIQPIVDIVATVMGWQLETRAMVGWSML